MWCWCWRWIDVWCLDGVSVGLGWICYRVRCWCWVIWWLICWVVLVLLVVLGCWIVYGVGFGYGRLFLCCWCWVFVLDGSVWKECLVVDWVILLVGLVLRWLGWWRWNRLGLCCFFFLVVVLVMIVVCLLVDYYGC